MIEMIFPAPDFRFREQQGQRQIFDIIRKKWVALQPEEWVRQNVVRWLIETHQIPAQAIALEKEIRVAGTKRRFDMLVYDANHNPWMLIECKSPVIRLDASALLQVLAYQQEIPVPMLMITNGEESHIAEKKAGNPEWISCFPMYKSTI